MFGLSDQIILLLREYFQSQPDITQVRVYGSRAMGTYKRGSDIDLVVFSNADHDISGHIKTALEELPTPYLFDVTDYAYLYHTGLKDHIDRISKVLYQKDDLA